MAKWTLTFLFGLASIASAIPAEAKRVASLQQVILVQPIACLCGAPYYAAQRLGYFRDEGLNLTIATVQGTGAVYAALQDGTAQFGVTNGPSLLAAIRTGVKDLAFIAMDRGLSNYNMVVSEDYAKAHAIGENEDYRTALPKLRGARIAVLTDRSTSALMLVSLQQQLGLGGDNFKLLAFTQDAAPAALQNGKVDASWYATAPAGGVLAFRSSAMPEFNAVIGDVIIATSAYIAKNGDVVRRIARAVARGSNALLDPTTQASALTTMYERFPNIPRAVVDAEILKPGVLVANGTMDLQGWILTNEFNVRIGIFNEGLPPEKLTSAFTLRFLPTLRVAP
jgi:ABC-type nitrate/sulfonate/bicarbonate transport system substrate-binding protein